MGHLLEVHQSLEKDVFTDTARIHESNRDGVGVGQICKLTVNGHSWWIAVRGLDVSTQSGNQKNWIRLDEVTRERLGKLALFTSYEFNIEPASVCGRLRWAMTASNPLARLSLGIAIWSTILSTVIGVMLGWAISNISWSTNSPPTP